jgi:hypothetical protein
MTAVFLSRVSNQNSSSLSLAKPGSSVLRFTSVRTRRPVPTSSSTEIATWPATSTFPPDEPIEAAPRVSVGLQRRREIHTRRPQRRNEAEDDRREQRDAEREAEDTRIRPEVDDDRVAPAAENGRDRGRSPHRNDQAEHDASQGEDQALGEELPDEARAGPRRC